MRRREAGKIRGAMTGAGVSSLNGWNDVANNSSNFFEIALSDKVGTDTSVGASRHTRN